MPRHGGFTLLELLVVLGVISVLMGVGVGFLQRGSTDLDAALAVVRDQLRVAATTARARGLPTSVDVRQPAAVGEAVRVQARGLRHVGAWHLESGERWLDARLRPQITGEAVPGRFGEARRQDPAGGAPLLELATGTADVFDLAAGFALRLEVYLEAEGPASVARLGRAFELRLDQGLLPEAKVTMAAGGQAGQVVRIAGRRPLPRWRWTTLEVALDGRHLALWVDGRLEANAAATGSPLQTPADRFEVGAGGEPVPGLVDEVQLLAYDLGDPAYLPVDVEWQGPAEPFQFDRTGELVAPRPARFALLLQGERLDREVAPGGVLRLPRAKGEAP